jgi:putative membrane-bound dehydrogenase-like protein
MQRIGMNLKPSSARQFLWPLPVLVVWGMFAITTPVRAASPLTPEQALHSFELEPGLRAELVAAEPLTVAPSAIAWDARGRLFVAENRGYPTGGPNGQPLGVIAMLEDSDGDGRCDRRTEFATGLTFPNGLLPWRGGFIVTCAPEVFFLADTNGDGRADVKEVLLTGFATNQSTQLRVNKPMLGLDGWVYLASGLSGGSITSPKRPGTAPLELKGDLRFRPDTGDCEWIDGKSQFGQSFDDFGRRFGVFNRVQVQHFVLPSRYVERNPHLASPGVLQNCPDLIANPLMRGGGGAARLFPISANITTADSHAGTFSAACAVHLWRGGILPEDYAGNVFSCDPTANLVHRDRLEPAGATFSAKRVGENVELFRSRDDWFRPVFLADGPDGALYVCDMYRKTIEHPEYLPAEIRKHTDFESGRSMGRLWRVTATATTQKGRAGKSLSQNLLRELESPIPWRRDTAFRLLMERRDPTNAKPLKRNLGRLQNPPAVATRLHLVDQLGQLDDASLAGAFRSHEAGVREAALRLAESRLPASARLQGDTLKLARDPDARVRFQAALALGGGVGRWRNSNAVVSAIASIATRDGADKWTRSAALSSVAGGERGLLKAVLLDRTASNTANTELLAELGRVLSQAVPANQHAEMFSSVLGETGWNTDRLLAFLAGFSETRADALRSFVRSNDARSAKVQEAYMEATATVASKAAPLSLRIRAAMALTASEDATTLGALLSLLPPGEPLDLQSAAVRALAQPHRPGGAAALVTPERWKAYPPFLRGTVLATLLARTEHHRTLLDAIELGTIPAGTLDSNQREQLRKSKVAAIRERAEKLLAPAATGNRAQAYADAKTCLALKPVPKNGRDVFKRLCAGCHRLDREGVAVGPDLFDIRNQPKESILLHIVIPEQEVAPNFTSYTCETRDGRSFTGLILAESAASVTLRQAQGLEETIPRDEITSLTASALSLMPQELEKGLSAQELADLLGYLKGEAD